MGNQKLTSAEISQLVAAYESELRKLEFQRGTVLEAISKLHKNTGIVEPAVEGPKETTQPQERKKRGPKAGFKKAVAAVTLTTAPEVKEETTAADQGKTRRRKGKQEAVASKPTTIPAAETSEQVGIEQMGKTTGKQKKKTAASESPADVPAKGKAKGKIKLDAAPGAPATSAKSKKEKTTKTTEPESKGKPGPKVSYNKWDHFIFDLIKKVGRPMTSADIIDAMKGERDRTNEQIGDAVLSQQLNRTLTKLGGKSDFLKKEPYSGKGKVYSLKDSNAKLPE